MYIDVKETKGVMGNVMLSAPCFKNVLIIQHDGGSVLVWGEISLDVYTFHVHFLIILF